MGCSVGYYCLAIQHRSRAYRDKSVPAARLDVRQYLMFCASGDMAPYQALPVCDSIIEESYQ